MTYEQLVQLFNSDDKYVTYIAKRFLIPVGLDDLAVEEGLPRGAFYRLFSDFPEYEQKFKAKVEEEDENAKDLFLRQSSMSALQKLSNIINTADDVENKDLIQACKAILAYRPAGAKPEKKSLLDSMFDDLVKGEDGK